VGKWVDTMVDKIDKRMSLKTAFSAADLRTIDDLAKISELVVGSRNQAEPRSPFSPTFIKASPSRQSLRSERKEDLSLDDMLEACEQDSKSSVAIFIGTEYVVWTAFAPSFASSSCPHI